MSKMSMIDPTDRDALAELMTRYVLGDLGDDEARAMRRLARERPAVAAELDRLQRTLDLIPYAAVAAPPPDLRARILAAVPAQPSRTVPSPIDARRPPATAAQPAPRVLTLARVVGSIAALLIVALAWDGQRVRQELALERDVAMTLQQPNVVQQFALHGTGISLAAGTVVLDLDAKRAAVAIHGLPALPQGQVYRLWARIADASIPCGQFNADANDIVRSQFTIPVDAYTSPVRQLFLNVEPAEQAAQPVGRTVMVST
jgi:anti-sigma-K factor RskA